MPAYEEVWRIDGLPVDLHAGEGGEQRLVEHALSVRYGEVRSGGHEVVGSDATVLGVGVFPSRPAVVEEEVALYPERAVNGVTHAL